MGDLPIPSAPDIVRIIGDSDEATALRLREYHSQRGGFFNYNRAQKISRWAFAHSVSQTEIHRACDLEWSATGKEQTREVSDLVWLAGQDRKVQCFPITQRTLFVRKDIGIRVKPAFRFIENRIQKVFVLQPRRGYSLNYNQLSLLASLIKLTYLTDDPDLSGLELLDLAVPLGGKKREAHTHELSELNILSEQEVIAAMEKFARAHQTLIDEGFERPRRPRTPRDLEGDDLFK